MSETKIINVTHNDLDGVGCPITLALLTGKYVEAYYCGYHDVESRLEYLLEHLDDSISQIFITDISFRKESGLDKKIDRLNKKRGYHFVRVVDHHATSSYLNKYDWAFSFEVDEATGEKKCATQWLYENLLESGCKNNIYLEEFVTLVNLWDTWRWVTDYPEDNPYEAASQLNMLFSIKGRGKFFADVIQRIKDNSSLFGEVENTLITCKLHEISRDVSDKDRELATVTYRYKSHKRYKKFVEDYLNENHITDKNYLLIPEYHKDFKVGVVYSNRNISDIGNGLAKLHPELDFIAIVSLPRTISFRSVKDLSVPLGIIANSITGKGGGHPQSAGGVLDKMTVKRITDLII